MNELQEKVRKYMTDEPQYRMQNKKYLGYEMKVMDQEVLISHLKEMNLKELQHCQGCGIPGHANTIALQLIAIRKQEMKDYLESEGTKPIKEVEAERELMLTTAPSLKQEGKISVEDGKFVEGEKDGKSRVRTSKKRRDSDSKEI